MYSIEKNDNDIKVKSPYNETINEQFRILEGVWKRPYWVLPIEHTETVSDLLENEYGSVDWHNIEIEISSLSIKDHLSIMDKRIASLDHVNKKFYIYSGVSVKAGFFSKHSWIKVDNTHDFNANSIFSKKIAALLNPFQFENITLHIYNVKPSIYEYFIAQKFSWVKSTKVL